MSAPDSPEQAAILSLLALVQHAQDILSVNLEPSGSAEKAFNELLGIFDCAQERETVARARALLRMPGMALPEAPPAIPPAERDRILAQFADALDAPLPDGYADAVTSVWKAASKDIEATVITHLLRSALFCDDVQLDHPALTANIVRRVAADLLLRAAVVCVHSAKKLEGAVFDPARFALVVFAQSEQWLSMASDAEHAIFGPYTPGQLRAELEAEGLIQPRAAGAVELVEAAQP